MLPLSLLTEKYVCMRALLIVLSLLFFAPVGAFAVVAPSDTTNVADNRTEWRGVVGGMGVGFSASALLVLGTPVAATLSVLGIIFVTVYLIWYLVDTSLKSA
jgi:hypothetical protein